MQATKLVSLVLIISFVLQLTINAEYDKKILNTETEKFICFIHDLNKEINSAANHSSLLKENFEKTRAEIRLIINNFIKLKNANLLNPKIDEKKLVNIAETYSLIHKIKALEIAPIVEQASFIINSLADSIEKVIIINNFANKSNYYKFLQLSKQKKMLMEIKYHLRSLHNLIKISFDNGVYFRDDLTEINFLKLLIEHPSKFHQLIDHSTLTLSALHNIIITQMEYIYSLQYTIVILEKEPCSIIDDIHEKKITLQDKATLISSHFENTIKEFIGVLNNSVSIINNGLAFLQSENTIFQLHIPKESEIESEIIQLGEYLSKL